MKDARFYKVTVETVIQRRKLVGGEWVIVDQVELADGKVKPRYDYAPAREVAVEEPMKVYEQTVEQLDLAALVSVVNGIVPREDVA